MKKLIVLALIALMMNAAARAEGFPEAGLYDPPMLAEDYAQLMEPQAPLIDLPDVKNPHEHEGYSIGRFDEEMEALFYDNLDEVNDEVKQIEQGGSLTAITEYIAPDGSVASLEYCTMIPCDAGRMTIGSAVNLGDFKIYMTREKIVVYREGEYEVLENTAHQDDVDHLWENYCFPFGTFNGFEGIRMNEYGMMYILMHGAAGSLYEFVADGNFRIHEIRRYMPDNAGDYIYDMRVTFETGGVEVPDEVNALLAD